MEEEEKRTTTTSTKEKVEGSVKQAKKAVSFIQKFKQLLAVPILGKIILVGIIALVVLFLIAGTALFFYTMPGMVRDKFAQIIGLDDLWASYRDPAVAQIKEETLKNAAMDLIGKGYDLEGYGFIDITNGDSVEYTDSSQREIKSIKSKYLTAYIASDNQTYLIANANQNAESTIKYSTDLIKQIILKGNPDAQIDETKFQSFLDLLKVFVGSKIDTNGYIDKQILAEQISAAIWVNNVNVVNPYRLQIKSMSKEEILSMMDEDAELHFGSGLIAIVGEIPDGVEIAIDRESERLIVAVNVDTKNVSSNQKIDGVYYFNKKTDLEEWLGNFTDDKDKHIYYYSLEGWITKYSKPYEFLITLHLSTMAPEFAYEVATSPETEAKVQIALKETKVKIELIVDSTKGTNESGEISSPILKAEDLLASDQANTDLNEKYSQIWEKIESLAESKTVEYINGIADSEARRRQQSLAEEKAREKAYTDASSAREAAKSAERSKYGDKLTKEEEDKVEQAGRSAFNDVYNNGNGEPSRYLDEAYNEIKSEVLNNTEFKSWANERIFNYILVDAVLPGIYTNTGVDYKDGAFTIFDKTTSKLKIQKSEKTNEEEEENVKEELKKWIREYHNLYLEEYNSKRTDIENVMNVIKQNYGEYEIEVIDSSAYYDIMDRIQKDFEYTPPAATGLDGTVGDGQETKIIQFLDNISRRKEYIPVQINLEDNYEIIDFCRQIAKLNCLRDEIAKIGNDVDFTTYVPYIVKVTNHWFRNLVFKREGTETLEAVNVYSEDVTRTVYQWYTAYFRRNLDPLITLYSTYSDGDPFTQTDTGYKYNVVEYRSNAIEQTDTPRVIDNSAYIRSLLNEEEYIIYDGNEKTEEQLTDDAKEKININKISLNAYAALETMADETSELLVRNLKELFKDATLSSDTEKEYTASGTQKSLSNIFPDYAPYTPWPSVFEKQEKDKTMMIYKNTTTKTDNTGIKDIYHYLVAPTNGIITSVDQGSNCFEFAYRDIEGELVKLKVDISIEGGMGIEYLINTGDEVTSGANLVKIYVPKSKGRYKIILNMELTNRLNEHLELSDYMDVPQREMTAEEIILMHNYIANEGGGQPEAGQAALAAVMFNRIANPHGYDSAVDVITAIEITLQGPGRKHGVWVEKDSRTKLWTISAGGKYTRRILIAIAKAANGWDPTKPLYKDTKGCSGNFIPIGAMNYKSEEEREVMGDREYEVEIKDHYFVLQQDSDMINPSNGEKYTDEYYNLIEHQDYDNEEWQIKTLLHLCTTIKNSYYFENSAILEDITKWTMLEEEAEEEKNTIKTTANGGAILLPY